MTNAGDAAEQIVRMSLEGTEVALRLSSSAAKNVAVALYAVAKDAGKNQTKGQQKLNAMLKSGKELKVFTVKQEDLSRFAQESKRYGVVYCVLQPKGKSPDGNVDILVRAEDASKINRIVERFRLTAVNTAEIKNDIHQQRAEHMLEQNQDPDERLVGDMMRKPEKQHEKENPTKAKTGKGSPSEPIYKQQETVGDRADMGERPSVRAQLKQIKAEQDKARKQMLREERKQPGRQQTMEHRNPQSKHKKKYKHKGR